MSETVILRSARDRLRYSLSFEITLMALLVPVGALFFDKALGEIGLLALVLSGKAMLWHLIYNWIFDRWEAGKGRIASDRNWRWRMVHAVGFEVTLMLTSLPIYMLWLGIGLLEALSLDIVVTSFVVGYTYVFTLIYDRMFPLTPVVHA